jgi:hypothetical protein
LRSANRLSTFSTSLPLTVAEAVAFGAACVTAGNRLSGAVSGVAAGAMAGLAKGAAAVASCGANGAAGGGPASVSDTARIGGEMPTTSSNASSACSQHRERAPRAEGFFRAASRQTLVLIRPDKFGDAIEKGDRKRQVPRARLRARSDPYSPQSSPEFPDRLSSQSRGPECCRLLPRLTCCGPLGDSAVFGHSASLTTGEDHASREGCPADT